MKLKDFFKSKAYKDQLAKDKETLRAEVRDEVLSEIKETHTANTEIEANYVSKADYEALETTHTELKTNYDNFEIDITEDNTASIEQTISDGLIAEMN